MGETELRVGPESSHFGCGEKGGGRNCTGTWLSALNGTLTFHSPLSHHGTGKIPCLFPPPLAASMCGQARVQIAATSPLGVARSVNWSAHSLAASRKCRAPPTLRA